MPGCVFPQRIAIVLSDWTDEDPMRTFAKLKIQSDVYNFNQPTAGDFFRDVSEMGFQDAFSRRACGTRCA